MKTVHVTASKEYDVKIGSGLLNRVGEELAGLMKPGKAVVVSGEIVFPLYGETVVQALEKAGFEVLTFVHPTGEAAKTLEVFGQLLNFLCDNRVSRTDVLVALGGGVTGDLTGFAAATYERGISFVQIPTTLLAMVDSSVGGKTAINLNSGKNQAGCFYQPEIVICDTDVLKTLKPEDYRCGCAEIIKHCVLEDPQLFRAISENSIRTMEEDVVARNVEIKSRYVNADEFDRGLRQKLNLGHSFGHAIEAVSGYTVHHGDAVAIGMASILRAAAKKGICSVQTSETVQNLLRQYDLPVRTDYPIDALYRAATADKKIASGRMNLILPERIGYCRMESVSIPTIREWMEAGEISG